MDKKKKISGINALFISLLLVWAFPALAQDVEKIDFGGKQYEYGVGKDSISLLLKVNDKNGKPCDNVYVSDFRNHFDLVENLDTIPRNSTAGSATSEAGSISGRPECFWTSRRI